MCAVPLVGSICTTCELVSSNSDSTCRKRLLDNVNGFDVVMEARNLATPRTYEVVDNVNSANPRTVRVQLDGDGGFGIVSTNSSLVPETTCARIILSFDPVSIWDEKYVNVDPQPDYLPVDGHPCSEFGETLIWYVLYSGEFYYGGGE